MRASPRPWCITFAAVCSLLTASCEERPPTRPAPDRSIVDGTWTGTIDDRLRGVAHVRLSVAGFGESARGTFTMRFVDPTHDIAGDVTISTIDRPRIELFFRATAAGCIAGEGLVLHARSTLATADRISGNYTDIVACGAPRQGTLELDRR